MTDSNPLLAHQVGELIRAARLARGLTQLQLADRIGLCTRSYICAVERGNYGVTLASLDRIARALNMDMRDLIPTRKVQTSATAPGPVTPC